MSASTIAIGEGAPRGAALPGATRAALRAVFRGAPWRWAAADVAVWAAVALLFAVQTTARADVPFGRSLAEQLVGFLPCALFTPIVAVITTRFPFAEEGRRSALIAHLAGALAFTCIGGAMMGALEWSLPWARQAPGVAAAMRGAVARYFGIDVLIYVGIAATVAALVNGREAREREVRAARLQTQLAEAQLHALSAQLHPHFLFNTLHAISALVRPDPRRAEQLIARLSELLRQMLDNSDRVEIALREELALLEKYVDIQEARFGPRLHVTFEAEPDVMDVRVPRLLLQPLVENAIRHGIARRADPGMVEITARREGHSLHLRVRDDGVGLPRESARRDGVGLSTTRARLAQLYGEEQEFSLAPGEAGGTVCTIRIPARRIEGHPV